MFWSCYCWAEETSKTHYKHIFISIFCSEMPFCLFLLRERRKPLKPALLPCLLTIWPPTTTVDDVEIFFLSLLLRQKCWDRGWKKLPDNLFFSSYSLTKVEPDLDTGVINGSRGCLKIFSGQFFPRFILFCILYWGHSGYKP